MSKERTSQMDAIEKEHMGRCFWQMWDDQRRNLLECMELKDTNKMVLVLKQFEARVPKMESARKWPELSGTWLYVPLDDDNTWDGTSAALKKYREANKK